MDTNRRDLLIGGSSLLVGSSVGFASGMAFEELLSDDESGGSDSNSGDTSEEGDTSDTDPDDSGGSPNLEVSDRPKIGDSKAPIKLFYWSDYQCPFCYQFESDTLPEIQSRFVDSGDVELVVKPMAVFGNDSLLSSLGSHCVYEQADSTREWLSWHNMLYERFQEIGERNSGWASPSKQSNYASKFDFINEGELESCINNEEYIGRLQVDRNEADRFGFEGTPFFVFYNTETGSTRQLTGAQPISRFEYVISSMMSSE